MKNKKTATLTVRIFEEEKEKLENEANARGLILSELIKEMIAKEIGGSPYDKNLMAEKKDIGLAKEPCPFCGIVVDWGFVKIDKLSSSADAKYCPNPDCREMVYTYNKEDGWRKWEGKSESKEAKEFDDLIEATARFEIEEKNKQESEKQESEKRESEKRESEKRESEKRESKKKEKEKVSGSLLGGWLTFDSEEESEKRESKEKEKEKEELIGTYFDKIITYDDEESEEE